MSDGWIKPFFCEKKKAVKFRPAYTILYKGEEVATYVGDRPPVGWALNILNTAYSIINKQEEEKL